MPNFHSLPHELHVNILEQLDFPSLPAAIEALAQLYASEEIRVSANVQTTEQKAQLLIEKLDSIWVNFMVSHLSTDVVNPGESNPDAILRVAQCVSYFGFAGLSTAELTAGRSARCLHQLEVQLAAGEPFVQYHLAALLFNRFSTGSSANSRDRVLGGAVLGSQTILFSALSEFPDEAKIAWLTQALFMATTYNRVQLASLLTEQGADVKQQNGEMHGTQLHLACAKGHLEVARVLVEQGAELDIRADYDRTPLYCACEQGHVEVVRFLLEQGASVNIRSDYGQTALHVACQKGHLEIVRLLIENGADVNAENSDGQRPLHWACANGHLAIAQLSLQNRADVNLHSSHGWAPLRWACEREHVELAQLLIENGADVHLRIRHDRTLLHWACEKGHLKVALLLVKKGANLLAKDQYSRTPLGYLFMHVVSFCTNPVVNLFDACYRAINLMFKWCASQFQKAMCVVRFTR